MGPSLILIHSPFLGPVTWRSTARALEGKDRRVHVPSLLDVARSAPPYWPAGADSIIRSAADEPVDPRRGQQCRAVRAGSRRRAW